MASHQAKIINTRSTCEHVLQDLKREPYLAVNAQGVNLSKTGPVTLLQIATKDGQVYLFDVHTEPRILLGGGLKSILESDRIIKVMHSSRNDAEALYCQFGVQLFNVFDMQLAHMELQRAEGRRYPSRTKLADLCSLYCPQKAALLQDKDLIQTQWAKNEGELWAKRPMTQEMIDCASQDVLVLIPEMYSEIKRIVSERDLTSQLTARTCETIEATIHEEVRNKMEEDEDVVVCNILRDFVRTARPPYSLSDINDEDVLAAIRRLKRNHMDREGLPRDIWSLSVQSLRAKVEEIKAELDEKGNSIVPQSYMFGVLSKSIYHSRDKSLKKLAIQIQRRLDKVLLNDIERKYNIQTPIKHLAHFEKRALDRCHLLPVTPVALRLYWLVQEEIPVRSSSQRTHPLSSSSQATCESLPPVSGHRAFPLH